MKLTHPTAYTFAIGGVEYRSSNGVFDIPDADAAIAMNWFGFTEAKRGRAKRAKAGGSTGTKAKPRSRKPKPKAKPQGEEMKGGMDLAVTSSYSLTPTFSFSGQGFESLVHPVPEHDTSYELQGASDTSYELQGASYKMKTVASDLASGIYRIGDRIRYYGGVIRPEGILRPRVHACGKLSVSCAALGYARHPPSASDSALGGNPAIGAFPWFGTILPHSALISGTLASYKLGVSLTVVARRLAPPRSLPRPPPRLSVSCAALGYARHPHGACNTLASNDEMEILTSPAAIIARPLRWAGGW